MRTLSTTLLAAQHSLGGVPSVRVRIEDRELRWSALLDDDTSTRPTAGCATGQALVRARVGVGGTLDVQRITTPGSGSAWQSWTPLTDGVPETSDLALSAADGDPARLRLFFVRGSGSYQLSWVESSDGGETWSAPADLAGLAAPDRSLASANAQVVYHDPADGYLKLATRQAWEGGPWTSSTWAAGGALATRHGLAAGYAAGSYYLATCDEEAAGVRRLRTGTYTPATGIWSDPVAIVPPGMPASGFVPKWPSLLHVEGTWYLSYLETLSAVVAYAEPIVVRSAGHGTIMLMHDQVPRPDATVDLRSMTWYAEIREALRTLAADEGRILRVIGESPTAPGVTVEVLMRESALRRAMIGYSQRILALSIAISLITASLVYLSLHFLMVRPMRRLTESMVAFRADPDDPGSAIGPVRRTDEIGVAARELAAMQRGLTQALRQKAHLAALGEAEETFVDLLRLHLADRWTASGFAAVPGIAYRDGPILRQTPARSLITDLDSIPFPDRDLLRIRSHTYLFSSRGCPFSCSFCASSRFWRSVRFFSPEYVVAEIELLIRRYGARMISFFDDLFIADPARVERIATLLERRRLTGKAVFTCSCRASLVTRDMAMLLRRMGVVSVGMGLESGNDEVLHTLKGSGTSVARNRAAVSALKGAGIAANASFIIGSPGETAAQMMDTYRFIRDSGMDLFDVYLLTPYPGTPVWELAKARGFVSDDMPDWSVLTISPRRDPRRVIILCETMPRGEVLKIYGMFRRLWYVHNTRVVVRHPMLRDVPRLAVNLVREYAGPLLGTGRCG